MRVITGFARGKRLQTLEGEDVRPTTDKVKEGLFSAIQFEIEGRAVLDLFAGSGETGLDIARLDRADADVIRPDLIEQRTGIAVDRRF